MTDQTPEKPNTTPKGTPLRTTVLPGSEGYAEARRDALKAMREDLSNDPGEFKRHGKPVAILDELDQEIAALEQTIGAPAEPAPAADTPSN